MHSISSPLGHWTKEQAKGGEQGGSIRSLSRSNLNKIFLHIDRFKEIMVGMTLHPRKHLRLVFIPSMPRLVKFILQRGKNFLEGFDGSRFGAMRRGKCDNVSVCHDVKRGRKAPYLCPDFGRVMGLDL